MTRELQAVVARLDPSEQNDALDSVRLYFAATATTGLLGDVLSSYEAMQIVAG